MKNYKYLLLVSTCLLFNNETSASELNLTFNSSSLPSGMNATLYTHTPNVELKPISNSGIKLAATCALAGGGCDDINFNLDNAAQCRDEGFGTSCPSGYVPGNKCPYNDSFFKCRACSHSCSSGSLAYCNSNQIETGSSRNDCNETCYTCRAKTCEEGGYASSINSCQKATSVSFAGKTCYTSVAAKNCTDGGYSASIPTNQVGQSTSYCGNTCYANIRTPACSEGGYVNNCPSNQVGTSVNYYGQTCYKNCYTPACSSGGFVDSCPANQVGTAVSHYGRTCYKDCYQPACSAGGYLASCPTNHSCTTSTYYGRTCYTDGGQASCSAGGFEASIPSGKNCTATSYYGRTCYKDCVNSCVENCSGQTSTCSSNQVQTSSCSLKCGSGTRYTCREKTCADGGYLSRQPNFNTCNTISYAGKTCYKDCRRVVNIYEVFSDNNNMCAGGPFIAPRFKKPGETLYSIFPRSTCSSQTRSKTSMSLPIDSEVQINFSNGSSGLYLCHIGKGSPGSLATISCSNSGSEKNCTITITNADTGSSGYHDYYVVYRKDFENDVFVNGNSIRCSIY